MKKVIYLLVLCMVLGMAGCGTNQENKEPVSGNVSVEIENKENDDVVQNEQTADTGSYPPCVMVDGVIYKDTGYVASMRLRNNGWRNCVNSGRDRVTI